ncbi:MAG: DUF177 domain-containing protein [Deltaproteobacteria bacterium]|nr:DUF177 domain-containing protein [Deltaproteobacteria bacterium]
MKLNLNDISEDGLDLKVDDGSDGTKKDDTKNAWWRDLLQAVFQETYRPNEQAKLVCAKLVLRIEKTCDNITLQGTAKLATHPTCARCLEVFGKKITVPIQIHLAPFLGGDGSSIEDDLNFAFYKGDEIDLAAILREMFLLEIPIRYLCKESCKGLCAQCGENLNVKTCQCNKDSFAEGEAPTASPVEGATRAPKIDPRWAALKKFSTNKLGKGE